MLESMSVSGWGVSGKGQGGVTYPTPSYPDIDVVTFYMYKLFSHLLYLFSPDQT